MSKSDRNEISARLRRLPVSAATVSVIGAVFGEWAGADEGLGRLVLLGNNQLQTPRVYAGIVLLTLMAVGLFALVALAERVACPWNRKEGLG